MEQAPKPGNWRWLSWQLVAAVAALAAMAGVTIALSSTGRRDDPGTASAEVVPFLDEPVNLAPERGNRYIPPPAGADVADCEPSDMRLLKVVYLPQKQADGKVAGARYNILLVKDAPGGCALSGRAEGAPKVTFTSASDSSKVVTLDPPPTNYFTDLPPRWHVQGTIIQISAVLSGEPCMQLPGKTWIVQVEGASNLTKEVPAGGCTVASSSGDTARTSPWEPKQTAGAPPATRTGKLTVTVDSPPTVPAGGILKFTVTLTNPTEDPFDLQPCPLYQIGAIESATGTTYRGRLNCAAAPKQIAAGDSLTFQMQITMPAELRKGMSFNLTWSFRQPKGAGGGADSPIEVV